jgi:hypothetical protein
MTVLSLAELTSGETQVPNLDWQLALPIGMDMEGVGIHIERFQRLRRFAGVGNVTVHATSHDQNLGVQGRVNDDGTVSSIKAATSTRQKPDMEYDDTLPPGINAIDMLAMDSLPDMRIGIDRQDIASKLGSSKYTEAAEHFRSSVNKQFNTSFLDASLQSNFADPVAELVNGIRSEHPTIKILSTAVVSVVTWLTYKDAQRIIETATDPTITNIQSVFIDATFGNMIGLIIRRSKNEDIPYRDLKWSLFNAYEPKLDRLAVSAIQRAIARPLLVRIDS